MSIEKLEGVASTSAEAPGDVVELHLELLDLIHAANELAEEHADRRGVSRAAGRANASGAPGRRRSPWFRRHVGDRSHRRIVIVIRRIFQVGVVHQRMLDALPFPDDANGGALLRIGRRRRRRRRRHRRRRSQMFQKTIIGR